MKLPLPADTQTVLHVDNVLAKTSNLGLLFNKYVSVWSDDWTTEEKRGKDKVNLKSEFLDKIEKESFCIKQSKEFVEWLYKRQFFMIQGLKSSGWYVEPFKATTDSRLIIGLGGTSVIETGMTLHPLYGFPYLPGSGLKGLARAYAEIALETKPSGEDLREIFGSEDKDSRYAVNNRQGKVFFMDGIPTIFPQLDLDIMNPHYGNYYRGEKDNKGNLIPPADYLNPVPVTFLAVATGQRFTFVVYSKDKSFAEKAKPIFNTCKKIIK
jgi:CRISPR-associated protein Cmr6